ncbi:hypothetical protein ACWU37_21010 (plasmid) [Photobacterium damselae subsp. damselae]|uniref:hypothetical protein n=1 Tax=Photobacterium damselae TaxID=38293 RepID=UPI001F3A0D13|nr:hypothetical protein [Photobacterium damselae]UKA12818.1 hypothetical protein IHC91_21230 [Photobacterium damselae subsp. damselae]
MKAIQVDPSEIKRRQLRQRQVDRDASNSSILESMDLAANEPELTIDDDLSEEIEIFSFSPAICKACFGRGKIKPMFYELECSDCQGTGYDLSDAINLIKWQKLCLAWSKEKIISLRHQLKLAVTSEDERLEESISSHYSDIKNSRYRGD